MTILFHPYVDEANPNELETWAFFRENEAALKQRGIEVVHRKCATGVHFEGDYEQGLKTLWGKDTIVICESDNVPTLDNVLELDRCQCIAGGYDYPLWLPYGSLWNDPKAEHLCMVNVEQYHKHSAFRVYVERSTWRWAREGDALADFAGFGCTKLSLDLQLGLGSPSWRRGGWMDFDSRVTEWMWTSGYKRAFHIHRPAIKHNYSLKRRLEPNEPIAFLHDAVIPQVFVWDLPPDLKRQFMDDRADYLVGYDCEEPQ